jgi:MFS family permease
MKNLIGYPVPDPVSSPALADTATTDKTGTIESGVVARLLPLVTVVFLGMLTIGVPLAVIPPRVHDGLGYGTVTVGWVMGIQSVATLLTRQYAGTLCDRRGSKPTLMIGMLVSALAGVAYLASGFDGLSASASLGVLVAGRIVLGLGESLLLTGSLAWGIGLAGPRNAGRAMAWNGIAMYGAFAAGAPVGVLLAGQWGWPAVAMAVAGLPLAGLVIAAWLPAVAPVSGKRLPFYKVLGLIWQPGGGLALATVAMAGLTAFVSLHYAERGWDGAGLALTAFGAAYIAARLLFGGLPDRLGGRRVALVSLAVEAVGQLLMWQADSPALAVAGAAVTGFGFSLVFPALGVEAVHRVPPANRALALGGYVACFDITLGLTGPVIGAVAVQFGYPSIFLAGALAALAAMGLAQACKR